MHDRQSTKFCKYPYCTSELPASFKLKYSKRNLPILYSITKMCSTNLEKYKLIRRQRQMLKKSKRSNRQNYSNSKKGLPKWRFSNKQHTSHLRATWINIKIQACSTMNIQSTCSIWLRKLKTIPHLSRQLHSNTQVVRANLIAMMKKKHRAHPGDLRLQCRATIQAGKTHISQESTRMT